MPSSPNYKRNYDEEYSRYQSTKKQRRLNDLRKKARRAMEKKGKVRKFDGKDVDHKLALIKGGTSRLGNLRVMSKKANRSFKRTKKAGMK